MIEIKDKTGKIVLSTSINSGSKRKYALMKEDYITLKFSLDDPIYFKLGDGIDNELGTFELVDLYKPTYNERSGGYDYELRLDAYYMKWKNKKLFYTPEDGAREASFCLTADIKTHVNILLKNLATLGYKYKSKVFTLLVDNSVKKESRFIDYQNINMIDALTRIAETFECEWWIIGETIKFGRCENSNQPIDLTFNDNVSKMSRADSQSTFATRIYAFGSERNIPRTYRRDLEFTASIDGGFLQDVKRPLLEKYFPQKDKIEVKPDWSVEANNSYRVFKNPYNEGQEDNMERNDLPIPVIDKKIGKYTVEISNAKINVKTSKNKKLNIDISFYYYAGLKNKKADVIKSFKNIEVNSSDNGVDLDINGFYDVNTDVELNGCCLMVNLYNTDGSPESLRHSAYDVTLASGKFTTWTDRIHYNALITVKGKQYNALYYPCLDGKTNLIQLPKDAVISNGDIYTIDNIIKSRVPASYFSAKSEITVEGIVTKRLMLPIDTPHIDAFTNMSKEDIVEEVVVFEDVYPQREGVMSEVNPAKVFHEDEKGNKTDEFHLEYTFKDVGLKNFLKDYVVNELHIAVQSKVNNGRTFIVEFVSSNDTGTVFKVKPIQEGSRFVPDESLPLENGTKYVLDGYDVDLVSTTLIPEAEAKLKARALEYIERLKIDPSTYDCTLTSSYSYNDGEKRVFDVGERVNLVNPAYFKDGRQSRIIGYELNLDIPYDNPTYTVGETAPYSRIGALESKVDSLTYKGQTFTNNSPTVTGGVSVYLIDTKDNETSPGDNNAFSSLRTLKEIKERAISKKEKDVAEKEITFKDGLVTDRVESEQFLSGAFGFGMKMWMQNGISYAEIDNLLVRRETIFNKLTIAEIKAIGGQLLITVADIVCNKVEVLSGAYRCYFDNQDGAIINPFVKFDQARCQIFNGKNQKYYWRLVVAVGVDYIDLSKSDCDGTGVPAAGDNIIQLGNRTDIARQSAIHESAFGIDAPFSKHYRGINSYSLVGKATRIESATESVYTGDFRIKSGNIIVPIPADIPYVAGQECTYYQRVSYNGALWLCIVEEGKKTTEVPSDSSQVWLKQVDKGANGLAGKDGKDAGVNLLKWQEEWTLGSDDLPNWNNNGTVAENERIIGDNPFGIKSIMWKCKEQGDFHQAGGWNHSNMSLDPKFAYRYCVFVFKTVDSGVLHHGTSGILNMDGVIKDNPYFYAGSLPIMEWHLVVGVIHPNSATVDSGTSGLYNMSGKKIYSGTDYKQRNPSVTVNFRSYNFYETNTSQVQYFYNPCLHKLDGTEPSIEQILQLSTRKEIDAFKTTYDKKFESTDKQFTSVLTETKTYTNNAVAGVQVGGVNLISLPPRWQGLGGFVYETESIYCNRPNCYNYTSSNKFKLTAGKEYTLSFKCTALNGSSWRCEIWSPTNKGNAAQFINLGDNKLTFTASSQMKLDECELRFYGTDNATSLECRITKIKLESGNIDTDYTLSQDDINIAIEEARKAAEEAGRKYVTEKNYATIDQTAGNILLAINNIKVGGKNLISLPPRWQSIYWWVYEYESIYCNRANYYNNTRSNKFKLTAGKEYTLSFKCTALNGSSWRCEIWSPTNKGNAAQFINLGDNKLTFTASSQMKLDECELRFFGTDNATSLECRISKIQLEEGNVATAWGLSQEELPTIDTLLSSINLSKEGVKIAGEKIELKGSVIADAIKTDGLNVGDKTIIYKNGSFKTENGTFSGSIAMPFKDLTYPANTVNVVDLSDQYNIRTRGIFDNGVIVPTILKLPDPALHNGREISIFNCGTTWDRYSGSFTVIYKGVSTKDNNRGDVNITVDIGMLVTFRSVGFGWIGIRTYN